MSTGYINARLILDRASIQANRANIISSSPSVIDASVPAEAKTLHLNAKLPDAQLLAGNLLLKAGRGKDALGYFEEYLKLEPKGEFAEQTQTLVKKIRKSLAEEKK
ncbi:MAG: hypothetical protein ACKVQW_02125 [Pyrinomonadaceae bacterium]